MLSDLLIILLLIAINGFLAMSELAIVSSRRTRLQTMADAGSGAARLALRLARAPGHFLSAVQVGITLVGLVAGAYSGNALAVPLADQLESAGVVVPFSDVIAFGGVMAVVTYVSLVVGELVPKQIALRSPEAAAVLAAPVMQFVTRVAWPVVALLERSSRLLLRLMPTGEKHSTVTRDEIRTMINEAEAAGVMAPQARAMMAGVMRLGDRRVRAIMTPRQEVQWIDLSQDDADIQRQILACSHSRLPAADARIDALAGVISTKEILDACLSGARPNVRAMLRDVPVVIDSMTALQAMEVLRQSGVHMLLVVDEYGTFQGLVTTTNFLEAIAGEFHTGEAIEASCVQRGDGSWLVDGDLPIDDVSDRLGLPLPAQRDYQTAAGFTLAGLMHIPQPGEAFTYRGWRIEVLDMDGRRIDKLLMTRIGDGRL